MRGETKVTIKNIDLHRAREKRAEDDVRKWHAKSFLVEPRGRWEQAASEKKKNENNSENVKCVSLSTRYPFQLIAFFKLRHVCGKSAILVTCAMSVEHKWLTVCTDVSVSQSGACLNIIENPILFAIFFYF